MVEKELVKPGEGWDGQYCLEVLNGPAHMTCMALLVDGKNFNLHQIVAHHAHQAIILHPINCTSCFLPRVPLVRHELQRARRGSQNITGGR